MHRERAILPIVDQPQHERLVEELAALPEAERRAVVREADARASGATSSPRRGPTVPLHVLRAASGVMHGAPADAVEDCDRLYDG